MGTTHRPGGRQQSGGSKGSWASSSKNPYFIITSVSRSLRNAEGCVSWDGSPRNLRFGLTDGSLNLRFLGGSRITKCSEKARDLYGCAKLVSWGLDSVLKETMNPDLRIWSLGCLETFEQGLKESQIRADGWKSESEIPWRFKDN